MTAFAAIVVAGAHSAVKSVPPLHAWLADAGHGGHLVRDLANTHLLIVIGGTVGASGLCWYVLPRILRRPLAAPGLAGFSYWATVIGAGGFYAVNVVVGLAAGRREHLGEPWNSVEASFGAWKQVPVALTATIMGLGYWSFVLVVVLTVWRARHVSERSPERHLAWFFVVGAVALLVGTVQGVIQVMPGPEDWLHAAAPAGEYIDPIAHAHVNLVTGLLTLLFGAALWWTRGRLPAAQERRQDRLVFWLLVPGSVAFYLTFMYLGVHEGRMIVAGRSFDDAVAATGLRHHVPLALAGSATFVGLATALIVLVRRVTSGAMSAATRFVVLVAAGSLAVGMCQGLLQLTAPVKQFIETTGQSGDGIANAHAQLNMMGGVLLLSTALVIERAPALFGVAVPDTVLDWFRRACLPAVALVYLSAMTTAIAGGLAEHRGREPQLDPIAGVIGPSLQTAGGLLLAVAFAPLAVWGWRVTRPARRRALSNVRASLSISNAPLPVWMGHTRWQWPVVAEFVGSAGGFPGVGWILAGRPTVGVPMALIGPAVAWAFVPAVMVGDGALSTGGSGPVLAVTWLSVTCIASTTSLAIHLFRLQRLHRRVV